MIIYVPSRNKILEGNFIFVTSYSFIIIQLT